MKKVEVLGAVVALDWLFNDGRMSKYILEKAIEIYKISKSKETKTVYVTEKELIDAGFGC